MAPEAYGLTTVGDRWPCQCSERKGIRGQFLTLHSGGTRRLVEECKVKNGPPSPPSPALDRDLMWQNMVQNTLY